MKTAGFFLIFLFGTQVVFGQSTGSSDSSRPGGPGTPTMREIRDRDFETRRGSLELLNAMKRERPAEKVRKLTKEDRQNFKTVTTPTEEDLTKYRDFLKKPKTGILRLLPFFECETKNVVRVDGNCANIVLGTWSYSFREKDYSNADHHDLVFDKDFLLTKSLLTQGILVALGDVALENVSLESDGLTYLTDFQPDTTRKGATAQYKQLKNGIVSDGFSYSNKVKAEENTTYALRVAAYRYKDKLTARFFGEITQNDKKFLFLQYDNRKDLIVAFRIIRKSEDGGITIVWKQLQEQKSPTLVFQENEVLADIK